MTVLLEQIVNGLGLAGPTLLVALSLTTVLAATRVLNVAIGATVIWAAFVGIELAHQWGVAGLVLGALGTAIAVAAATQFLFLSRQRGAASDTEMASFAATLGLSSALTAAFAMRTDGNTIVLPPDMLRLPSGFSVAGVTVRYTSVLLLAVALVLALTWALILRRTSTGRLFRAMSSDHRLAHLSGLRTRRLGLQSWLVCGVFLGTATVLILIQDRAVNSNSGSVYLLIPFAAVVAGGMGSLSGTVIACLAFGVLQGGLTYFTPDPGYRDAAIFILLFVVLVLRPNGIRPVVTGAREY